MSILRRIEGERFSEVLPLWAGKPVVLIGTGPSLTLEQVELVGQAHDGGLVKVIAVNDAYLLAPWADVHYAADAKWHKWHSEGIPKPNIGLTAQQVATLWKSFAGEKCTIYLDSNPDECVHMLRNRDHPYHGHGLSSDPRLLVSGRHSGFQALNVATLAGSKLPILIGYDGQPTSDGRSHFFGEHPRPTPVAAYEQYRLAFSAAEWALIAAGVRVINCSPGSRIDSFEKADLQTVLSDLSSNIEKARQACT